MIRHIKYETIKRFLELSLNPLLIGEAGTGKTTVVKQVADDLGQRFETLSLTKQTSVGHIIGFKSVTGDYIPTTFRDIYENGGIFLLDEIDAADPNTLLCLNTIDNGYVSFPDKRVEGHKDFKLAATANPASEGNIYTGRSKLDFASLNRFLRVEMPRDSELEIALTSKETVKILDTARKIHSDNGSSVNLTMRDSLRYDILSKENESIVGNPITTLLGGNDALAAEMEEAIGIIISSNKPLSEAADFEDLLDLLQKKKQHTHL